MTAPPDGLARLRLTGAITSPRRRRRGPIRFGRAARAVAALAALAGGIILIGVQP